MTRVAPLFLLGLAACTPQSAQVPEGTGAWMAYLPASTSNNVLNEVIDFETAEYTWGVDCTNREDRLDDRLDICAGADWPPTSERWLENDGFVGVGGALEPIRGEAIMTNEGDMQIGFHHRLPGGERFRFAFVIDPVFQPTQCLEVDGQLQRVNIDGNWLEGWSADVDAGTLYYLNAGSYQFNPSNTEDIFNLPEDWLAGYSAGRFGSEEIRLRTTRFGRPSAYDSFESEEAGPPARGDIWYAGIEAGTDPATSSTYTEMLTDIDGYVSGAVQDLSVASPPELMAMVNYQPRMHGNLWRTPNASEAGLDGWGEMHYNYVVIDEGSDMTVGGSVSGTFHLMFDAGQTRVITTGEFTVDAIQKDRWSTNDVRADKLAENASAQCGG